MELIHACHRITDIDRSVGFDTARFGGATRPGAVG